MERNLPGHFVILFRQEDLTEKRTDIQLTFDLHFTSRPFRPGR